MPLPRSTAEILAAHAEVIKNDIRKCVPATVTAVHPDRQTVDVQVAINNLVFDELGNAGSEPAPSISDVPLGVLRGGGMLVWIPVAAGDSVLLIFSDSSADTWRAGDGSAQDPGFAGKHTLDSAFAIPMFAPDAKMMTSPNADPTKIIIGQDGGAAQIRISEADIELGAPATDFVAMAAKVLTELQKIQATLLTGTVAAAPGRVTFGTPYTASPVASTLVKTG